MNRSFIVIIIFVTAVTWITVVTVNGFPKTFWEGVNPFLIAISVTTILAYIYEKMLWHCCPLQQILARTPDLRGAWRVIILPAWVDPSTEEEAISVEGYAQVDQTASTLCIRLFTQDSRSETFAFSIEDIENEFRLTCFYQNSPRMADRPRSGTSHQGSAIYRFRGYRPNKLEGEYWTETKNTGEITLSDRRKIEIGSFGDGARVFN